MPSRLAATLLATAALLAACAVPARADDPGRWRGTGFSRIGFAYYQGVTSDDRGRFFFDGIFTGLYRADDRLREQARTANAIPPTVTAAEGYNHIGDIGWDAAEGGRVLLPLECYYPGTPGDPNTCRTGSIGVADPETLRWRYYVKLDPAEIPKAMWAEPSPDGTLVWTSSGPDLLAYRAAEIEPSRAAPRGAPLRAVRRLVGAVPPTGVTGAVFWGDRLLLAGQSDDLFQVWSVDLASGARQLEIERRIFGESEGLDVLPALGGVLHWIVTPIDPRGRPPTYGASSNVLLHFVPSGGVPRLQMSARPRQLVARRRTRVTFTVTRAGAPGAGALVRAGGRVARTGRRGRVRIALRPRRAGSLVARATRADARAARVVLQVVPARAARCAGTARAAC